MQSFKLNFWFKLNNFSRKPLLQLRHLNGRLWFAEKNLCYNFKFKGSVRCNYYYIQGKNILSHRAEDGGEMIIRTFKKDVLSGIAFYGRIGTIRYQEILEQLLSMITLAEKDQVIQHNFSNIRHVFWRKRHPINHCSYEKLKTIKEVLVEKTYLK